FLRRDLVIRVTISLKYKISFTPAHDALCCVHRSAQNAKIRLLLGRRFKFRIFPPTCASSMNSNPSLFLPQTLQHHRSHTASESPDKQQIPNSKHHLRASHVRWHVEEAQTRP